MSKFLLVTLLASVSLFAADEPPLWQIGTPDNNTRDFALAPGGYNDYAADGFFIVGESDAKRDWPYVHPGPSDPWGGKQPHTFTIAFALDAAPAADGKFAIALADTQAKSPPKLTVRINGRASAHQMPPGAGDDSVFGKPERGKPHRIEVPVPAALLKAGVNTIEVVNDEGSWVLYDCLSLAAPGAKLGKVPEGAIKRPPKPKGVEEVVIVFKTHFDIGYTAMASEVVQRYRTTMIDQALQVVDKNKDLPPEQQFAWTIPGWPMHKILEDWDGQKPERKQRIQQALKDGRFVVHGLPFTTHTETLEPEDLVRGLGFSSRICRALNLELPRDAKMTDVPSHSWIVPTLLRHAGVDFLHLGCNAACRSPKVPPLFWWEGPDGSRLMTMYTAEGYGTGLIPPRGWPYPVWLALIHTGDNHGPPTPDEVKKLLDEAARRLPGVKVRIGRLSDFSDALRKHDPQLPVVRGDMPDTWIHGPMCDPAGAALARGSRPQIAVAEALHTHLRLWDVQVPDAAPKIAEAYENSLLYGEHTWGGAQYWITKYGQGTKFGYGDVWKADREKGRFKRLEESWDEHTSYIRKAHDVWWATESLALLDFAKATPGEGKRIVVYNPLPWKRSGFVRFESLGWAGGTDANPSVNALKPLDGGNPVPARFPVPHPAKRTTEFTASFCAQDVPPMGYRIYVPVKIELPPSRLTADGETATIESPFFKVILDPARCAVKSLVEKKTGRELVDTDAPYGFGQYLYERFDVENTKTFLKAYVKIQADWATNELGKPNMPPKEQAPYTAVSPADGKVRMIGPGFAEMSALLPGRGPYPVTLKVTLYEQLPYADFHLTLNDKPADPWPEAGWFCFPFKVADPQFRLARLGAIVDPAKDCVEGCNNELFWLNGGMAVLNGEERGVGLWPRSALVSLGQPGCWRYTTQWTPRKPHVFVNLFNNQWTTNFRMWNEGPIEGFVRVWAIDKYHAESSLVTPSLETRFPLRRTPFDGPAGKLSATQSGLELSRTGVAVTAFGPNPDGKGTVLRLWEQSGQGGTCRVTLPKVFATAQPCDLRGRPVGDALPIRDGAFEAKLDPFAPASFILE
jgi:hypothetical protein